MKIDINELDNLKEKLDALEKDDILFIDEEGSSKYALMNMKVYEEVEEIMKVMNYSRLPQVKIESNDDIEVSYEEYEQIKKQLLEVIDEAFKPKPENLN